VPEGGTVNHHKLIIPMTMVILLTCFSCAYKFSGEGPLPSGVTSVQIPMFANRTGETGIENVFTNDLINEFILKRKSALRTQEDAEATIIGAIEYIRDITIAHKTQRTSTQRRVIASVALRLIDAKGQTLWSASGITANEAYEVTDDKLATEQNKREALNELSKRLAEKLFNRLTDNF
jgi:hypothetical protein